MIVNTRSWFCDETYIIWFVPRETLVVHLRFTGATDGNLPVGGTTCVSYTLTIIALHNIANLIFKNKISKSPLAFLSQVLCYTRIVELSIIVTSFAKMRERTRAYISKYTYWYNVL